MDIKSLNDISYGVYVIGSGKGKKRDAMTANTVIQVAPAPPTVAISVAKSTMSYELIKKDKAFTVSVMARDTPLSFIGKLGFNSGRKTDKLKGLHVKTGLTEVPIITDNAVSYLEVRVKKEVDIGDYTLFIGHVVDAEVLTSKPSLSYSDYIRERGGTTPDTSPSHNPRKKEDLGPKYWCVVCGYTYDPEQGDPESGIKPGTPFDKLPDDWVCPVCGARKDLFKKVEG
jgi:flavin reductase (DIM6/NTAB) family NADH-FMN oxidoreductase RutF/rubredoxin